MADSVHHTPRRRLPISAKRRAVELTLRPGASIGAIAHEYGVSRNSLHRWQGLYHAGKLGAEPSHAAAPGATFLPVAIAPTPRTPASATDAPSRAQSVLQVTLASGAALRIETGVLDTALICALVAELRR